MDTELLMKEFNEFLVFKEMRTKAVASTNTAQLMHGNTGLFSQAGLNPEVFSAMLQPAGLGAILPKIPTRFTNPQFPILTGQEDDNGTEPDSSCGDPVRAGFKKLCVLTAQFGILQRGTDTIDPRRIITLINRGEFTDLQLIGNIQDNATGFLPDGSPDPDAILNNVVAAQLSAVATSYIRNLSRQLWQGSFTAGATDGFREFAGLDSQITTGHVDSFNNVTCPAADSFVYEFNYDLVGGTGNDIVEYMAQTEFDLYQQDIRLGLTVERVVVMRRELWQELTANWPIAYNTNRGAQLLAGNTRLIVDGGDMISQRDAMRRSMTIDINARTYKVVLDDGISELNPADNANIVPGQYASNIYFVPVKANNFQVTRLEHLDYKVVQQMLSKVQNLESKVLFWTNNGMYLWTYRSLPGFCFDIVGSTEMRVVLQTPHLAARINNVKYQPLAHLRDPYPTSPYLVNGGVSTQPSYTATHAVWNA